MTSAFCIQSGIWPGETEGHMPVEIRVGSLKRTYGGKKVYGTRVAFHPAYIGNIGLGTPQILQCSSSDPSRHKSRTNSVAGRASSLLYLLLCYGTLSNLFASNNKQTKGNNIGIIKIDRWLNNKLPILNKDDNVPPVEQNNVSFFVAGFGLQNNDIYFPESLIGTTLPYYPNCIESIGSYNPVYNVCGNSTVRGTCDGDGGAPIVLAGTNKIIGVNSYSNGPRCTEQTTDVYTRMSTYEPWIQYKICQWSDYPPSTCFKSGSSSGSGSLVDSVVDSVADASSGWSFFQSLRDAFGF